MRRRDREAASTCASCQQPLERNAKYCGCGAPTANLDHEERIAYELAQWRAYRARAQESY